MAAAATRLRDALLEQLQTMMARDDQGGKVEIYVEHETEGYEALEVREIQLGDQHQGGGVIQVAKRGAGAIARVVTGEELAALASRRFNGQLGRVVDGVKDAVAKNANLASLKSIHEGSLLDAMRHGVATSSSCLRCGPAIVTISPSPAWRQTLTGSTQTPGVGEQQSQLPPHPCDAAKAAFEAVQASNTPTRQCITVMGHVSGMMHSRDHILRALVEPQRLRQGELVSKLGTALGILASVLSLDGAILYSPSEVRLLYRIAHPSQGASGGSKVAELVGASLDVYLIERDPVKYEGFLDLLSGAGTRALGLEGLGLAALLPQSSHQSGRTVGAILRAVEELGVSSNEAVRFLRSMAVSSILSRASTPLAPNLYRAFDYLATPNRLSKAAIQRVGQSERDLKQLAREVFSSAASDFITLLNTALAPTPSNVPLLLHPSSHGSSAPCSSPPSYSSFSPSSPLSSISVLAIPAPSLSSKLGRFSDLASAYAITHSFCRMAHWLETAPPSNTTTTTTTTTTTSSSPTSTDHHDDNSNKHQPQPPASPVRRTVSSGSESPSRSTPAPSPPPPAPRSSLPVSPSLSPLPSLPPLQISSSSSSSCSSPPPPTLAPMSTEMDDAIRGLVEAVNRATLDRVAEHKMEGELKASLKLGKADDVTLPWGETLLAKPLIRLNAAALPPALAEFLGAAGKRRASNWGGSTVLDGLVSWVDRILDDASGGCNGAQLVCCLDVKNAQRGGAAFEATKVLQQIRLYKLVQVGLAWKYGGTGYLSTPPSSSSSSSSSSSLFTVGSGTSATTGLLMGEQSSLKKNASPRPASVGLLLGGGGVTTDVLVANSSHHNKKCAGGKGKGGEAAGESSSSNQQEEEGGGKPLGVGIYYYHCSEEEEAARTAQQQQQLRLQSLGGLVLGGGGGGGVECCPMEQPKGLLDAMRRSDSVWEEARRVQDENRALKRRNEELEARNAELLLKHGDVYQGMEVGSEAHRLQQLSGLVRENVQKFRGVIWEVFRFEVNKEGASGLRKLRDEIVRGLDGLIAVEDAIEKTRTNIATGVQIPRGF